VTKSDLTNDSTSKSEKTKRKEAKDPSTTKNEKKFSAKPAKAGKIGAKISISHSSHSERMPPVVFKHDDDVPEGLPRKYFLKSTFNTQDIMHAPVEKTLKMLDKILAGERLFTM